MADPDRLAALRAKLKASTKGLDGSGPPLPGYKDRVDALRTEIARLEAEDG